MPSNKGKQVAAVGLAVAATAGGVAHFSGALSRSGDDALRGAGRLVDEAPPISPSGRRPEPQPLPGEVSATDDVVRQGEQDDVSKDVICFAYENFYDESTGSLSLPSQETFVSSLLDALVPGASQLTYRLKAESLYETLSDPDLDAEATFGELACDL